MDEDSRRESLRLWDVLERVGVSERMRQLHRDTMICREILGTVTNTMKGMNISRYYFGSSSEGTTTPGMYSDEDIVHCAEDFPVIDDIQQSIQGMCFLTHNDLHTHQGYVKLQIVYDRTPHTIHNRNSSVLLGLYDCAGRACVKHHTSSLDFINERSGPADTSSNQPGLIDTDYVAAYRSRTFPRAATKSLLECTRSGWLTRYDVERMMGFGCLFVGVGHPASDEKEIEWRVSFSLQERQLMFSLNPTQHKCYVLLKLIKNMLTSQLDGENCITSYHCKTCVFRSICKMRLEQWIPENLIHCTFICLDELLQCLHNNDCPNFFMKANNMFERRVSGEVRERLIHSIRELLQEGFRVFYRIQSDNIGEAFRGRVGRYIDMEWNLSIKKYNIYWNACTYLIYCQVDMCRYLNNHSNNAAARYLSQQICYLSSIDTITEHTHEEAKAAVSGLIPILHKLYAQQLASLAFSTDVPVSMHHLLQASARHLRLGMTWDLMSGRLLYATILYRQGNIDLCRRVLEQMEQTLNGAVESACKCHEYRTHINDLLRTRIQSGNTDPLSIMKVYMAACTIFLPSHSQIIPTALQYEMYRSVGTQPGSRNDDDMFWFDCVAVDSKVYLYFVQYLIYSALNRPARAQFAINDLDRLLMLDENLGHRETGYNLLGWIHIQEGRIPEAIECFRHSWSIQPDHNAAKWHVLQLYQRLARQQ